eukprot:comp24162_c0_seq1/m.44061 comp24162_c0_seq1/g.44061  ORF comp24162_c0_seq1/g.44061 comp24162_c0_seq1/m.44061 type:complete len:332 (+) comp24162_c0_seq1:1712-2707(+)
MMLCGSCWKGAPHSAMARRHTGASLSWFWSCGLSNADTSTRDTKAARPGACCSFKNASRKEACVYGSGSNTMVRDSTRAASLLPSPSPWPMRARHMLMTSSWDHFWPAANPASATALSSAPMPFSSSAYSLGTGRGPRPAAGSRSSSSLSVSSTPPHRAPKALARERQSASWALEGVLPLEGTNLPMVWAAAAMAPALTRATLRAGDCTRRGRVRSRRQRNTTPPLLPFSAPTSASHTPALRSLTTPRGVWATAATAAANWLRWSSLPLLSDPSLLESSATAAASSAPSCAGSRVFACLLCSAHSFSSADTAAAELFLGGMLLCWLLKPCV